MNSSSIKFLEIVFMLTKRQVIGRYKGSSLGLLWSFLNPFFMMVIYTFAFSFVFGAKWGINNESHFDYALILFSSLTVFNIFADVLREAPYLLVNQPNFVKKVVFPLSILPLVSTISSLIHASFSFFIFFAFALLLNQSIPFTAFFLPLVLFPLVFFSLGVSYFVSSLGVYIRDTAHFISHMVTIFLFTSPVFFATEKVPTNWKSWIFLNPLSLVLESSRSVLIFGRAPDWNGIFALGCFSVVFCTVSKIWFQRTSVAFADYL